MSNQIATALEFLLRGEDVPVEKMQFAVSEVMRGEADERLLAALLTGLRMKGEAVSEIVGAARAMIECATRIPVKRDGLLDTCGTGGDHLKTFNISTATALVAASAGVPVAKHGNRSVSSSSGSADVLEALGVNVNLSPDQVGQCVDQLGIGFCFAPLFHGSMKHAMPVRKVLGFRTLFNVLGPLTNPAGAEFQLLGVADWALSSKVAWAISQLGRTRAFVVIGEGPLDEVCLWGETTVHQVEQQEVTMHVWTPDSFGLPACQVSDLQVDSPQESAQVIEGVLNGNTGPARDMILANTAAALLVSKKVEELKQGVELAQKAIDQGAAKNLLEQLKQTTNSFPAQSG